MSSNPLSLTKGNNLTYLLPPCYCHRWCSLIKTSKTTYVITTDDHFQMLRQLFSPIQQGHAVNLIKTATCGCVTPGNLLEMLRLNAERRIQRAVLTACFVLEMSSIWTCRSSISTSMDLRALTAAAQVNSDSSSWNRGKTVK